MILRERHVIDTFKVATGPMVVGLMVLFQAFDNSTAWLYLAMHGTYGLLWVLKSRIFGDKNWERPCKPFRLLLLCSGLALYWGAPVMITWLRIETPVPAQAGAVALFGLGVFLHFAADMQKSQWLALQPGRLLTSGLWARTRNPNYLGELLIYGSFCLMAWHFLPPLFFLVVIAVEWIPNMLRKDKSLSRYPEFAAYKARSGWLFPRLG